MAEEARTQQSERLFCYLQLFLLCSTVPNIYTQVQYSSSNNTTPSDFWRERHCRTIYIETTPLTLQGKSLKRSQIVTVFNLTPMSYYTWLTPQTHQLRDTYISKLLQCKQG